MVKYKLHWAEIVALILFLFAVYLILTTIFGDSATPIEVTAILFGSLGTLFVKVYSSLYKLNREVGEMNLMMKHSFQKVKEDIGLIKKKLRA